jgi:hypothetical protein
LKSRITQLNATSLLNLLLRINAIILFLLLFNTIIFFALIFRLRLSISLLHFIFPLCHFLVLLLSWNGAMGRATGYGLDHRGDGVLVPVGSRISLLHVVRTGSEAHPASYTMGTWALSPVVKRPECEAAHSPPTSAEVKKIWIYTPTPLTPSWRSA